MKAMRMMGNITHKLATEQGCSDARVCEALNCTPEQYQSFLQGRLFLTFNQLEKLAELLKVPPEVLLDGDEEHYNRTVVHCEGKFSNPDDREFILDIIDDYLLLLSSQQNIKS